VVATVSHYEIIKKLLPETHVLAKIRPEVRAIGRCRSDVVSTWFRDTASRNEEFDLSAKKILLDTVSNPDKTVTGFGSNLSNRSESTGVINLIVRSIVPLFLHVIFNPSVKSYKNCSEMYENRAIESQ